MTDQRWYGRVHAAVFRDGVERGEPTLLTECPYCWALVLEARYPRHLATHEAKPAAELGR